MTSLLTPVPIQGSSASIIIENIPQGNPRIIIKIGERTIGSNEIASSDAQLIRDLVLEGSLRAPQIQSKGGISFIQTSTYGGLVSDSIYWPGGQLKFLWNDILGRPTRFGEISDKKYLEYIESKYGIKLR